jgi:hypothetical protein
MAKVTITDFSGGITDTPFNSPENCGEVCENVLIQKDKSLKTSPGIEIYDEDMYRVPSNSRVSKFIDVAGTLCCFSGKNLYKITGGSITEVTGPVDSNHAFNLGDADSIVSVAPFNNHWIATNDSRSYPIKIWKDGSNAIQMVTAGLPQLASDPTITPSAGANSWVYAFVYYFAYTVGTTDYEDYGPIRTKAVSSATTNVSITNIPVLSNGSDYNYDTANIKVKIYRTLNGGSTFYYVGQITNGTTSYSDTASDAAILAAGVTLYTSGGILDNDPPPPSKWVWEANGQYHFGDILDGANEKPNREVQSVTSDPDSVPASFFTQYNGTLMGGGAAGRANLIFTDSETVRRDGVLDETGRGTIYKETISTSVGCVAHNSIVKARDGLYWAAEDGFYFSNGYSSPVKLARRPENPHSSKIDNIYRALQNKNKIQGCYDPNKKRVYWTAQEDASDNDVLFIYEEDHDSFTTITNSSGILPTALIMDGDDLILGDSNGYLFRLSEDYYTYPAVEVGTDPEDWGTDTIIYRWKSIHAGFGDASVNKWITKINAQGNPDTNVDMACLSYTNGESSYKELYPFSVSPAISWGDPTFTWGDSSLVWNRTATMNQTRRFPAGRLRARHRAIELTNAYITIQASTAQAASRITVNGVANTATLVTPADYVFATNYDGYDLIISTGTYTIVASTADTLTLSDPDGTLVNGTYTYEIKGYPKGQRAHIMNLSLEYETLTDTGTQPRGVA